MEHTFKVRIAVLENSTLEAVEQGWHIHQHFTLRESYVAQFDKAKRDIEPFFNRPHFEFIDDWHRDALRDIFASELVTGMSNNVADYVWDELLPERYKIPVHPPTPARTPEQICDYVQSFSNSSKLLKNIFARELKQLRFEDDDEELILHQGSEQSSVMASKIVDCMLSRGDAPLSSEPLKAIVDLAFPELFFGLRQLRQLRLCSKCRSERSAIPASNDKDYDVEIAKPVQDGGATSHIHWLEDRRAAKRSCSKCRSVHFSIAASSDHNTAIATPVRPNDDAIERIRREEHRLTAEGEVKPSWREYTALFAVFIAANVMLVLGISQNWANRKNMLERVFDGTGLFALTTGVMLAVIISRKLDFYDLVGIVLRKRRFLQSYAELLTVLNLSDAEVKSALTFQDVRVWPIARERTSYAFEDQMGPFNPFSGLDTTVPDTNIIVGNKSALSRGKDRVRYYDVNQTGNMWYLKPIEDAKFRIVTDGDDKIVQ